MFSVFENLPPNGACPGLYAVDAQTREISWIGGWDARFDDSGLYPAFTADGKLSYAHIVDPNSPSPPVLDIQADGRVIARALWAWSPRRDSGF